MKVVAAIDSFKGSLSSMEAGNAAKEGILLAKPDTEVVIKPLADGGEGTTDALIGGYEREKVEHDRSRSAWNSCKLLHMDTSRKSDRHH